jgi:carnitine-CoA ligase
VSQMPHLGMPPVSERTVFSVLAGHAEHHPDRIAVSDPASVLTYGELFNTARRLGAGLATLASTHGDRVLVMVDNHVASARIWAALATTGRVEVPINTAYRGEVLSHQVNDSGARVAIVDHRFLDRFAAVADALVHLEHVIVLPGGAMEVPDTLAGRVRVHLLDELEASGLQPKPGEAFETMAIMYTSGTTGRPKGVLVSHAHAYTYGSPAVLGAADSDDTAMVVLPLFHVGGQWAGLYNAWIAGAHAYVSPQFQGNTFWTEAAEHGCTYALLVGAMANHLVQQSPKDTDRKHQFRRLFIAPVPAGVERFTARFGVEVGTGYGSTEAGTVLVAPFGKARPGACGMPPPGVEVRIADEVDQPVVDGQTGELLVRRDESWTLMQGYLNQGEATADAWKNLWYHTGDAMFRDTDGQYIFVDRLGDAIRRRGENIPSALVEDAANRHPAVLESAAVAVPGELEHEILLAVVPQPDATVEPLELFEHLVDSLPHFMVPRFVACVSQFERTPSGKIRKAPLRAAGAGGAWDCQAAGFRVTRRGLEEWQR